MATIRKRGNRYQVQVRRKGLAPAVRTFTQRTDADEWARFMESQADRGGLPVPARILERHLVRHIIERYRDEITPLKRSAESETCILNAFLRDPIAKLTIAQLAPAYFHSYRERRLKTVKPGTVNRELSIIKHAFDTARDEWAFPLRDNPLAKLKKLKVNNARSRRLSPDELIALQTAIVKSRNPLLMPLIRFALATGMRRGEMLRVEWEHINEANRTLFIPITKNGHSRTIPLSQSALKVISERRQKTPETQRLVFPISANALRLAWVRLAKRSGIKDLHFHDLRHEAISHFFEFGLSVPEVAMISGHRDYRMLARYTHMKAEKVAEKLHMGAA